MRRVYKFFGGRKNFNGYLALVVGSVCAILLSAPFAQYAGFVALVLGISNGSIAWEDRSREISG